MKTGESFACEAKGTAAGMLPLRAAGAQEGRQPAVFHPLVNHPFSLRGHGEICRAETIRERQRIFSTVGEHSVLPCRDLFAVSDKLLLHRSATLRRVRHNSAAQLVSLDITSSTCEDKLYRMSKFAGAVCYNVLKICAALLSRTLRI